jgi:hypothetical protein
VLCVVSTDKTKCRTNERKKQVGMKYRVQENVKTKIPVRARFFAPIQTSPGVHPTSYTLGTRSLSRELSGRGVALTTHPHPT